MDDGNKSGLKPPPEFQEDLRAPVIQPNTTDELWLIQWPIGQIPDFDGQQLSLDLARGSGKLGTCEGLSGKSYDVVSLGAQEPKAMVFLSSAADSKIAGEITRRVSIVNYLEPDEVPKDDMKKLKRLYERSSVTSFTNSALHFATPSKTVKPRTSTHTQSSLSEEERTRDKKSKRKKHVV